MPNKTVYLNFYGRPCDAIQRFDEKAIQSWIYEEKDGAVFYVTADEARKMQGFGGGNVYPPAE